MNFFKQSLASPALFFLCLFFALSATSVQAQQQCGGELYYEGEEVSIYGEVGGAANQSVYFCFINETSSTNRMRVSFKVETRYRDGHKVVNDSRFNLSAGEEVSSFPYKPYYETITFLGISGVNVKVYK